MPNKPPNLFAVSLAEVANYLEGRFSSKRSDGGNHTHEHDSKCSELNSVADAHPRIGQEPPIALTY
jgi:hypothetical protein